MDDQIVIQKVTEGDVSSFRFLVEKYKGKAFSVAFSMMRNQAQAEDVVQEAFINAFRKLDTFRGDATFSTWLMRIVVNESIKVLRKKKQEIEGNKQLFGVDEYELNSSLGAMQNSEQRKYIDETMEQMPQREALVLQLYYLDDLSLKEMEDIMELKADHIKVLLFRARKRFYNLLALSLKHELKTIL